MAKRIVPKNYRNVTGIAASQKCDSAQFESTLERDYLALLEFDKNVKYFDVQPITIKWFESEGKERSYTPDVLVTYNEHQLAVANQKPLLCEIKYRDDIKKNWKTLKPKFKAAIKYAKQHGWRFKLITEVEIKTSYTNNAKFLLTYLQRDENETFSLILKRQLHELRECTIESLLKSVFIDKWSQAELIPTLWQLIAQGQIGTDLNQPLTMSSSIWSKY